MASTKKRGSQDIEYLPITFDELLSELRKVESTSCRGICLDEEQKKFLKLAVELKVSHPNIIAIWNKNKKWGTISKSGLARRIEKLFPKKIR